MADSIEQQVKNGLVWENFCDALKRAGQQILRPEAPSDELNRAEGFRYLSRLIRLGLEMNLEVGTPEFPTFIVPSHETAKIGADNPDMGYLVARIDGKHRYCVSGNRGSVASINFSTKRGGYDSNGRLEPCGFIDTSQMQFDADGNFELILSDTPQPGNWLKTEADCVQLIVRQIFHDRKTEKPANLRITRLDSSGKPPALDAATLHDGLTRTASFVENTARTFADWAEGYLSRPNELPPADQAVCQAVGGDPNIFYYHSYWELAEDEALVIDVERIPPCDYWNIQIDNYWMESLDYRYFQITLNCHSAVLAADGSLRLVLAHADPGVPNWLETAGHHNGTICFRWIGSTEQVHPRTKVVKLAELRTNA